MRKSIASAKVELMKDKRIYVTAFDARRLRDLLEAAGDFQL